MLPDIQAGLEMLARAINGKMPPIGERTLCFFTCFTLLNIIFP